MRRILLLILVGSIFGVSGASQDPYAIHDRYIGHLDVLRGIVLFGYPDGLIGRRGGPVSRAEFAVATNQLLQMTEAILDTGLDELDDDARSLHKYKLERFGEHFWRLEYLTFEFRDLLIDIGLDDEKVQERVAVMKAKFADIGIVLRDPFSERFVDVPSDHWADDAIHSLRRAGILYGYPDGLFRE